MTLVRAGKRARAAQLGKLSVLSKIIVNQSSRQS